MEMKTKVGGSSTKAAVAPATAPATGVGRRPDVRIAQVSTDKDGKTEFANVGGIWFNDMSKGGKVDGNLKLGDRLRLLLFKEKEITEKSGDYRVVQATTDKDGKVQFLNVGNIFLNKKEGGKSWGLIRIGELRLTAFVNTPKEE